MKPHSQRGAAILTAMLTVVLVATLTASALWQQWRAVEVEAAERGRTQSGWVLTGALDWARLILREDARKGGADHLAEPWAVPLEQARLSTFLAADRSDVLAADETQDAFLSGQIIDLQSRLNVTNLIQNGKVDEPSRLAFTRLFDLLNLPASELVLMIENLRMVQDPSIASRSNMALPLAPQELDQLTWVGLAPRSLASLRPYITLLPIRTTVNLNTAAPEVIYACVEAFEMADASRFVRARELSHLVTLTDASRIAGSTGARFAETEHGVASRFFEVRGFLQVEQTLVQEQSLVQRDGMDVKTLARKRGALAPGAPLQ